MTFNSTEQADAILTQLRADLIPLGITTISRGRLTRLPPPPAAILVGPGIRMRSLAIKQDEAQFDWMLVIMRPIAEDEERAEELDTWADAAGQSILTVTCSHPSMSRLAGDGPDRLNDDSLIELLQGLGRQVDATILRFTTLREILLPCA